MVYTIRLGVATSSHLNDLCISSQQPKSKVISDAILVASDYAKNCEHGNILKVYSPIPLFATFLDQTLAQYLPYQKGETISSRKLTVVWDESRTCALQVIGAHIRSETQAENVRYAIAMLDALALIKNKNDVEFGYVPRQIMGGIHMMELATKAKNWTVSPGECIQLN